MANGLVHACMWGSLVAGVGVCCAAAHEKLLPLQEQPQALVPVYPKFLETGCGIACFLVCFFFTIVTLLELTTAFG